MCGGFGGLAVGATVTHHAVLKDMTLALMVFVNHLRWHDFADIGGRRDTNNIGNVQVSGISVLFNGRLLCNLKFVSRSQC